MKHVIIGGVLAFAAMVATASADPLPGSNPRMGDDVQDMDDADDIGEPNDPSGPRNRAGDMPADSDETQDDMDPAERGDDMIDDDLPAGSNQPGDGGPGAGSGSMR
jgi:hypothetical protein